MLILLKVMKSYGFSNYNNPLYVHISSTAVEIAENNNTNKYFVFFQNVLNAFMSYEVQL